MPGANPSLENAVLAAMPFPTDTQTDGLLSSQAGCNKTWACCWRNPGESESVVVVVVVDVEAAIATIAAIPASVLDSFTTSIILQ